MHMYTFMYVIHISICTSESVYAQTKDYLWKDIRDNNGTLQNKERRGREQGYQADLLFTIYLLIPSYTFTLCLLNGT